MSDYNFKLQVINDGVTEMLDAFDEESPPPSLSMAAVSIMAKLAIAERLERQNELMVELVAAVNSRPLPLRNVCGVCGKELAINSICSCGWAP